MQRDRASFKTAREGVIHPTLLRVRTCAEKVGARARARARESLGKRERDSTLFADTAAAAAAAAERERAREERERERERRNHSPDQWRERRNYSTDHYSCRQTKHSANGNAATSPLETLQGYLADKKMPPP